MFTRRWFSNFPRGSGMGRILRPMRNKLPRFKRDLSPQRQRLAELMQNANFGTIYALPVRAGEPILDPLPRVVREFKFSEAADNGPRPELDSADFALKSELVQFFEELD